MTQSDKFYVDKYYKSEPVSVMATHTGLSYLEVLTYCRDMGYITVRKRKRRPEEEPAQEGYFDIDNYNPATI